jgi:hypothetical protein
MNGNPASGVYGTIAVGALLAAESARRETYPETVGAVVITLLLYWIAHSYAQFTGHRLRAAEKLTLAGLVRTMAGESWIMLGAAIPLLTLVIWWAAGAQLTAAVSAAIWTSAGMVTIIEVVAGLRADLSGHELVAQASLGVLLGLLVIVLRLLLH